MRHRCAGNHDGRRVPRQAVSNLGTTPSQPRPYFLDCNKQRIQTIESTIMIICKMIKTGSLIKNV